MANQHKYRNRILAALSPADLALLDDKLEHLKFAVRYSMEERNRPVRKVYFVESGIVSVVAKNGANREIEVGLIGCEGLTGIGAILGSDRSPNAVYAQVAGDGHCLNVAALRDAMNKSARLRDLLLKYANFFMIQTSQTALCNGRAHLSERLARWLLMAHDRIQDNNLPLTHEFLALMLGVRRAGVTVALRELHHAGVIDGERGHITVVSREGLEEIAGSSYGVPEAEYRRLIGGVSKATAVRMSKHQLLKSG
jgi:CRP-like cAMP-binding protein